MSDLFNLRIRMAHSIDAGAVRFLLPDRHAGDETPLAAFERELRRIVDEEVAKATAEKDAEVERLRAALAEIAVLPGETPDDSWSLTGGVMVRIARKALEGKPL